MVEWIYLLEMIKITEGNVPLQILYLEYIALACFDFNEKTGIARFQKKVFQELFSPNSNLVLKNIINFELRKSLQYEKVAFVTFARDKGSSIEDFLDLNRCLDPSKIGIITTDDHVMFNLQSLSVQKDRDIELIFDYIVAVLGLFYSLCKGRNKDAINKLSQIFTYDLVYHCMCENMYNIKIKRAFILLFEVLYIDIEPHLSLSQSKNRCYMYIFI